MKKTLFLAWLAAMLPVAALAVPPGTAPRQTPRGGPVPPCRGGYDACLSEKGESRLEKVETVYEKRQAELKAAFDQFKGDWLAGQTYLLTGLGILLALFSASVAWFGVWIPYSSSRELKRDVKKDLDEIRSGKDAALAKLRVSIVDTLRLGLGNCIVVADVASDGTSVPNMSMMLMHIVICFDDLLEMSALTGESEVLRDSIKFFRPFLSRWSDSSVPPRRQTWDSATSMAGKALRGKKRETSGRDFERLLGRDSEELGWLKVLYKDFAPWRFE